MFQKLIACRSLIPYFQQQRCELLLNKAEPAATPNKFHIPAEVLLLGTAFILPFAGCLHYSLPLPHGKAAGDIPQVQNHKLRVTPLNLMCLERLLWICVAANEIRALPGTEAGGGQMLSVHQLPVSRLMLLGSSQMLLPRHHSSRNGTKSALRMQGRAHSRAGMCLGRFQVQQTRAWRGGWTELKE